MASQQLLFERRLQPVVFLFLPFLALSRGVALQLFLRGACFTDVNTAFCSVRLLHALKSQPLDLCGQHRYVISTLIIALFTLEITVTITIIYRGSHLQFI